MLHGCYDRAMPLAFVLAALAGIPALAQTPLDPNLGVERVARARARRAHFEAALRPRVHRPADTRRGGRRARADSVRARFRGRRRWCWTTQPDQAGILKRVDVNGVETPVRQVNGHIIVPAAALHEGENAISLEFNAGNAPLNRSDDFLYTIFVPSRAHLAFPCFDQPDLKARWSLSLDVPEGWQALGNGAEIERGTRDGRTHVRLAGTEPISTYLFAFAAGKFEVEQAQRDGRTFRMFHRETDAAKVARNRDAIFDLHAGAIAWLERYTGIPYPFGKFDFLLVPAFQFGGMEHPGAIFYNASGLMLDESATQDQMLGRASVIAHETSHMWFGDLVTMQWFSDVWMKEVFANYMAAKIVNPAFPAVNHDLRFLRRLLSRRLRRRPHRRHQRNPPAAGEPERRRHPLRRDHLPEGADRHATARDARGTRRIPGRAPRVSEDVCVRQRLVARPDCDARPPDAGRSGGLEPCLGRGAGPARHPDGAVDVKGTDRRGSSSGNRTRFRAGGWSGISGCRSPSGARTR